MLVRLEGLSFTSRLSMVYTLLEIDAEIPRTRSIILRTYMFYWEDKK